MRRALLTPLLVATLTGCSLFGQDTPCTLADVDSHVSVLWEPTDFGARDAVTIRLCAHGTCKERRSGSSDDPFAVLTVSLPDDIGPATVPVRLTVTSAADGAAVVEDSTRARLTVRHPNGTSCPPTVWTATYRAHPDRGLTSTKGLSLRR